MNQFELSIQKIVNRSIPTLLGGAVCAAAEGALPQLHEPQDGQVGAGAHLDGRARRLLLRVPAQGVDPIRQEGHAGEWSLFSGPKIHTVTLFEEVWRIRLTLEEKRLDESYFIML